MATNRPTAEQAYWSRNTLDDAAPRYFVDARDWDALVRHVNGGESYASIARSLAVSPSTVRRRLAALRDPIRWSRDQEARDARTDQITADNTAREVAFDSHDWTLPPAVDADETTALMRCDSCGTELRVRRQGAEPIITPWDYVDLITCPLASPVTPTA